MAIVTASRLVAPSANAISPSGCPSCCDAEPGATLSGSTDTESSAGGAKGSISRIPSMHTRSIWIAQACPWSVAVASGPRAVRGTCSRWPSARRWTCGTSTDQRCGCPFIRRCRRDNQSLIAMDNPPRGQPAWPIIAGGSDGALRKDARGVLAGAESLTDRTTRLQRLI